MSATHHLAQLNIARMVAPITDPVMADFVAQLDYINSVADRAPGFVWRLQSEGEVANGEELFGDDRLIINMSVWESIEALYEYTYRSDHLGPLRNRRSWFEKSEAPHLVMWWVPAGHLPDLVEAKHRLERLTRHGPGPEAFTFRHPFDADLRPLPARPRAGTECGAG